MIQLEFAAFQKLFRTAAGMVRRKPRPAPAAIDYTLRLSSALRCYNLTHAIHDVLCAVAKLEVEHGHATIPAICHRLSCTYQCVMQHFLKNPELFIAEGDEKPRRYRLTAEGIRLLGKIKTRIERHE